MILNFNQEKATLCIKNKTIKSPEQRTDLLDFSRTNTVDSHTVFKKTNDRKTTYEGCSIEKRLDSFSKQAIEKTSEFYFPSEVK